MNRKIIYALSLLIGLPIAMAEEGILLQWRLPEGKSYRYDYIQEAAQDPGAETIRSNGEVLVFRDKESARMRWTLTTPQRQTDKRITEEPFALRTVTLEQLIPHDGIAISAPAGPTLRDDLLMPLPQRPLFPGITLKQEMVCTVPYSPPLDGTGEFTYVGSETINGLKCVHFHVSCALRSEPKPNEKNPETATLTAEINARFASDAGYFLSVDSIIHTRTSRPVIGASEREQGVTTVIQETRKTSLRLAQ